MSAYAARYRAARGYAGLSQDELAKRLGVSDQTIKRRESGKQDGTVSDRIAVAVVCGVPPEFMEGGWGTLQPSEIKALLTEQTKLLGEIRAQVALEREVLSTSGDDLVKRWLELARQEFADDARTQAKGQRTRAK